MAKTTIVSVDDSALEYSLIPMLSVGVLPLEFGRVSTLNMPRQNFGHTLKMSKQ